MFLQDERGSAALFLTLAFLIVGTTLSTSVLFSSDVTSKKIIQEHQKKELEYALKATLEMVRHDINTGEFTMKGLDAVAINFKRYPDDNIPLIPILVLCLLRFIRLIRLERNFPRRLL